MIVEVYAPRVGSPAPGAIVHRRAARRRRSAIRRLVQLLLRPRPAPPTWLTVALLSLDRGRPT